MDVHQALTKHIQKKEHAIREFDRLDRLREEEIERLVNKCLIGQPFTTDLVNEITERMQTLGRENLLHFPERKKVTPEMVSRYVQELRLRETK